MLKPSTTKLPPEALAASILSKIPYDLEKGGIPEAPIRELELKHFANLARKQTNSSGLPPVTLMDRRERNEAHWKGVSRLHRKS